MRGTDMEDAQPIVIALVLALLIVFFVWAWKTS
jgi:hypothetical protein